MVVIDRIRKWLEDPDLLERYFSADEILYVQNRGRSAAASLAARFAAKEAFGKALGRGLKGLALKDIRVFSDSSGRPVLQLDGSAEKALREAGGNRVHLSLTHDGSMAIAQVIIEGE